MAGLLIVLVLLATVLSSSFSLHKAMHTDADDPGHQCLVTLLHHGQLDLTLVAIIAAICLFLIPGATAFPTLKLVPAVEHRLLPGRAPPCILLAS